MKKELFRTVILTLKDGTVKRYTLPEDNDKERFAWFAHTGNIFASFYARKYKQRRCFWHKYWKLTGYYEDSTLIVAIRARLIDIIQYE